MEVESDAGSRQIIGAAIEVHRTLGSGYLEAVYQEALAIEFRRQGISFQREAAIPISYKGEPLGTPYRADFVCPPRFLVELKAVGLLGGVEESQVIHYLKSTGYEVGLLLNFGASTLQIRRLTNGRRPENVSPDSCLP